MKRLVMAVAICAMLTAADGNASVWIDNFDTPWTSDYAPGWENTAYRHGEAPVGKMMEQVAGGRNGTSGMKLIADSTPETWMWWASVSVSNVPSDSMAKKYNPWVSAWYYDQGWESGSLHAAGQIMSVPSWVNPYLAGDEDWTDVQFGARMNQATPADNYYYVASGQNSPGWVDTKVDRTSGWVNLKMQLLAVDGKVHFSVNGVEVGASYRDDYIDLGETIGLYTMFTDPLLSWGNNKPYTIWDDFAYGSDAVPEPATIIVWSLLGLTAVGFGYWRRKRAA